MLGLSLIYEYIMNFDILRLSLSLVFTILVVTYISQNTSVIPGKTFLDQIRIDKVLTLTLSNKKNALLLFVSVRSKSLQQVPRQQVQFQTLFKS